MKLHFLLLLFIFTAVSLPSTANDNKLELANSLKLFNPADADRIVLVGFADQNIHRVQNAMQASYRRRGEYQSSTWSRRITTAIAEQYNLYKITEWPMTEVGIHCVVYSIPSNQTLTAVIERLAQDKRIDIVQKMNNFNTKAEQYNDPYFKLQTNMRDMRINDVHGNTTGKDVTIALIDTGVDMDHPDLIGKVGFNKNFVSDISSSFFNDKHGTAVAGIMVAQSNNRAGIIGVAPDAGLIVLKACWPDKSDSYESICNSFSLALAINKAIKLRVKILNLSLAGPRDALLEILLNKAISDGMIIVAADPGFIRGKGRFPASLKNVISVQTYKPSEITGLQESQEINAPGVNVLTTLPNSTYDFVSGSSLAAAHISGVIALLMELKPDLTLAETKNILHKSIGTVSSKKNSNNKFNGFNVKTAISELCKTKACSFSL